VGSVDEGAVVSPYASIADELRVRRKERGPKDTRVWLVAAMKSLSEPGRPADWVELAFVLADARMPLRPHGTYAAMRRHERYREPLCEDCREFRREHARKRMAAKRERDRDARAEELDARVAQQRRAIPKAGRPRVSDAGCVDMAAVLRAMDGEPVELTAYERREAVRLLTRRGVSHTLIAKLLGVATRTVQQHVKAIREAA
jgi:DNA-binding NarL/FixJ family response regulator